MPKYVIGSAVMLLLLFICVLFAPYLAPFDPHAVDVASKLMPPSQQHLLGTDQLGRDVLSRLLYGARYSLLLAVTISLLELSIGAVVGLVVGWYQGRLEAAFLWLADVISAFTIASYNGDTWAGYRQHDSSYCSGRVAVLC